MEIMKYPNVTLGRVEAVWNKLGGEEGVEKFLRDELVVSEPPRSWHEEPKPVAHTLEVKKIHDGASFLEGPEFMCQAKALPGAMSGDKRAFDYYSKPEHWAEMNIPEGITVIVFANTEFDSGDGRYVRCLCLSDGGWYQVHYFDTSKFSSLCSFCGVAVPSPLNSGTEVS